MQKVKQKQVFFSGACVYNYPFTLYPLDVALPDTGAVYIFTSVELGLYEPLYIGETATLETCVRTHEKWGVVKREWADGICVYFEDNAATRHRIVRDLVEGQQPKCQGDSW